MITLLKHDGVIRDGLRFILFGCINTILTLTIYLILLNYMHHSIAYTISWIFGIIFLVIVYPSKVFPNSKATLKKRLAPAIIYPLVYLISLFTLHYFVSNGVKANLAIFIVIPLSLILNFLLMRMIFRSVA